MTIEEAVNQITRHKNLAQKICDSFGHNLNMEGRLAAYTECLKIIDKIR